MSNIIKQTFVSFLEQKKTIEIVNTTNQKIINPYNENTEKDDEILYPLDEMTEEVLEEELGKKATLANDILEDAYKQAEEIILEAKRAAEHIENDAKVKGYDEGYKLGKQQLNEDEHHFKQQMTKERNNLIKNLQPKISQIIQTLVSNMIGVQKFEEGVILFLIKTGLEEIELSNDVVIKISEDDFDEVINNKQMISDNLSQKIQIEIIKDHKLHKNDCLIETSLGIIDCSLDTRLEGLLIQLKLIEKSY